MTTAALAHALVAHGWVLVGTTTPTTDMDCEPVVDKQPAVQPEASRA